MMVTNVSCNGFTDGSASLTISGGTPGYLEDWGTNNPNSIIIEPTTILLQILMVVTITIL